MNVDNDNNMHLKLRPLSPVKFPSKKRGVDVVYHVHEIPGQPTKIVIAEMKKLSRNDIFATS